jgi:hypothetical protein
MLRRRVILVVAVTVAAVGACACWPRQSDLRVFDPTETARLECAMWRDYYEQRYVKLFYHLAKSSRTQFGFSPLDSVRIAFSAARAAKTFQPTQSRQEANAALPYLLDYFGLLRTAAPVAFDPREAARLELDWWQARREAVGPQAYGKTIAEVAALTYGITAADPAMLDYGVARAEAMAYRDARGQTMTDEGWMAIERQLRGAYERLKAGVGGG